MIYKSDESNSYIIFGKLKQPIFLAIDAVLLTISLSIAFLLRFDMDIPVEYIRTLVRVLPLAVISKLCVFYFFEFYNQMWKYASLREAARLLRGITAASILFLVLLFFTRNLSVPRTVLVIDWLLSLCLVGGSYLIVRARKDLFPTFNLSIGKERKRVAVVGAGEAGSILVKQMLNDPRMGYKPVAVLDDDRSKRGLMVHGVEVVGDTTIKPRLINEYNIDEVILAIPSASLKDKRRIALSCEAANVPCKTIPDLVELIHNDSGLFQIRNIEPKEVLGRKEVDLDLRNAVGCYAGRVILITGAAGSIGSEICRQIIDLEPAKVIATDIYENGLYEIDEEVRHMIADKCLFEIQIMDVRDEQAVERVFEKYGPDIVFHAAAYKHVPMMEKHPLEVIQNNSIGTNLVIQATKRHACERFILISTDKAVNPSSIMGLSKQFCEKAVKLAAAESSSTKFMAVRFGNVLGSNGSVVPKFNRQIKNGEPITITHSEITRYFMTIQEAVFLVTQAAAIGNGSEIFVLDMGEPVRIIDMARNMIRLAGLEPDVDIPLIVTGLRPGEKLYEELFNTDEKVEKTIHPQINLAFDEFDSKLAERQFEMLQKLVAAGDEAVLLDYLRQFCIACDAEMFTISDESLPSRLFS